MSVSPTAVIDPAAIVDSTATIGPHVVIEGPVRIGPHCRVAASAVLLGHTEIGAGCTIHSHVVIGDVPQDRAYGGGESYCRIGRDCILREGVTVHRGTAEGSATIVGDRCFLMTNSHVGHNCVLGDGVTLISGALLGGHVEIGPRAIISGNAAIHQFVRIGELAMVSGVVKIAQDVPPFMMIDRDCEIVGVNRIGMMRAGMSSTEREEIKTAYKIISRSGYSRENSLQLLANHVTTDAGRRLLAFMSNDTSRGVCRTSLRNRRAA